MLYAILGVPSVGWIALSIWCAVNIIPWTYSMVFVNKINKSGVERWGAKKTNKSQ